MVFSNEPHDAEANSRSEPFSGEPAATEDGEVYESAEEMHTDAGERLERREQMMETDAAEPDNTRRDAVHPNFPPFPGNTNPSVIYYIGACVVCSLYILCLDFTKAAVRGSARAKN